MKRLDPVVRVLGAANRRVLRGCEFLTLVLVAAIAVVVCMGVFWRYVLNDALVWSEETAKFLMVWMVFVAAPIALARGGHAAVDALPNLLPPRLGQALYALIHLLVMLFVLVLIDQGTHFALNARIQHTPTTGISMMYVFLSMPVGGVLLLLVSLELLLRSIAGTSGRGHRFDPSMDVHRTATRE